MNTLTLLDLTTSWACEWFELDPDLYEFLRPEQVPDLRAWTFDQRRLENWSAWLYRRFELPADDLLGRRWLLCIDAAPSPARLYLNDQLIAEYEQPGADEPPFDLDVTGWLRPGSNHIAIRVEGYSVGNFDGLSLRPAR
jgi:beta-galactosidase/beta-glucuronidase